MQQSISTSLTLMNVVAWAYALYAVAEQAVR